MSRPKLSEFKPERQSVKDVRVVAWFNILKDCLEQMPDTPVYQLAAPMKKDVYQWYLDDHARLPDLYPPIHTSYFMATWRKHVPEVRLRRVLRFTKCKECESLREKRWDRSASQESRDKALSDLQTHYRFVKGERGYALTKAHKGVINPTKVLSMAQDGTSQLPNGIPQFAQALHGQEQAHNRMHHHMTLTMVHGMGTKCYVTRDNIAGDPNLSVECLQRTLQWVEDVRGELPPQLYLQLDNCWRENKNNTLINWLASLVERGLFPGGIEVGFLPMGHTHNEVDQAASRISIALRRRDIHTAAQLMAMLKECFADLDVELVTKVADTKSFLNPGNHKSWKKSRFMRHQNITAFRYFLIDKAPNGDIHIRTKYKYDGLWSRPKCPIKGQGPESTKRVGRLRPQADVYGISAVKVREALYRQGVMKSLELCRVRVSPDAYQELLLTYRAVFSSPPVDFHWKNGGVFHTETLAPAERGKSYDEELRVPGASGLFQDWQQVINHRVCPEPSSICAGHMVAVDTEGILSTTEAPDPKFGFRMGKVCAVDRVLRHVKVQWWTTSSKKFQQKAVWRPWIARQGTTVNAEDCFYTFNGLTSAGRVKAGIFRSIEYTLTCREDEKSLEEIRSSEAAEFPQVFNPLDLSEYNEDHQDARPSTSTHKARKRKTTANASDADDDGSSSYAASYTSSSSSSSHSSSSFSSSSSSSSSAYSGSSASPGASSSDRPRPADVTSRYFDDECRGEANCKCDFKWCLVAGASSSVLSAVYNHNISKARELGKSLSNPQATKEWMRLEELIKPADTRRRTRK